MGENGKRTKTVFLSAFSVLLMILVSVAAGIQYPLIGFDLKTDDILVRTMGPRKQLVLGPFNPEIDPQTGVFIQDMTGICKEGRITAIQFTVGLHDGHPPVNLSRCRFHYMGTFESIYYQFNDQFAMAIGEWGLIIPFWKILMVR